jgi:hypothetical protein
MRRIALATLPLGMLVLAQAAGLVNTEAGTFRCRGTVVRLDAKGIPSSGEPGGQLRPCSQIVQIRETI